MWQESYKWNLTSMRRGAPRRESDWRGPMAWAALGFAKRPRAARRLFQNLYPSLLFSIFVYFCLPFTAQASALSPAHDEIAAVPHPAGEVSPVTGEVPPVAASTAQLGP